MAKWLTIGVPKAGAKLFLWVVVLLVTLMGCTNHPGRDVEVRIDADPVTETAPSATMPSATASPVAPPISEMRPLTPTMAPDTGDVSAAESPAEPTPLPPVEPTATPTPGVCPYLRGRTETGTITSVAMGEQPRYLVHLPPCYDQYPDRVFPTLYLFHGWPLNEWHWIDLGVADWADDWVSRGLIGPFIIVMPGVSQDGRYVHSSGGDGSFEGFVVNELVPHIDATYRTIIDPSGRALGGISRGGVWALEIALRNQDVFSRVGGHSPALAVNNPLPQYDPYLLIREDISSLQFYLDAGTIDWTRSGLIRFRDALIDQEAEVIYEVHEGNHVDALWRGAMPDYVAFYTAAWPADYDALPSWGERDRSTLP